MYETNCSTQHNTNKYKINLHKERLIISIDWDPNNLSNRLSEFLSKDLELVLKIPKISDEYSTTGFTVWSNMYITFLMSHGTLLNRLVNLKKAFCPLVCKSTLKLPFSVNRTPRYFSSIWLYIDFRTLKKLPLT